LAQVKLSVIIPCYNESPTIAEVLERVIDVDIEKEIIFVDDGSIDGSADIAAKFAGRCKMTIVKHNGNIGKGAAVRTGLKYCTGDIVIIQDADLEYNPKDYHKIIEAFGKNGTKVVYGSRNLNGGNAKIGLIFWLGGFILSKITNLFYGSDLTDEPTCYKAFKREIIQRIEITDNSFNWEREITAKLLKEGYGITEVPIDYEPRDFSEGKKLGWVEGFSAYWALLKYRFGK